MYLPKYSIQCIITQLSGLNPPRMWGAIQKTASLLRWNWKNFRFSRSGRSWGDGLIDREATQQDQEPMINILSWCFDCFVSSLCLTKSSSSNDRFCFFNLIRKQICRDLRLAKFVKNHKSGTLGIVARTVLFLHRFCKLRHICHFVIEKHTTCYTFALCHFRTFL